MTDDERQQLQDELLMAELANKRADTALKDEQRRWETMRALAAFAAGVAVFGGLVLGVANLLRSTPTPPQVIFQPGAIQVLPATPAPR